MAQVTLAHVISSGNALIAASVSNNFTACVAGINSVQSDQIQNNAVLSQHISNNAILAAKISDNQINQNHFQFNSGSTGVQVERIGSAPPTNGIMMARYSNSFAIATNAVSASAIVSWNQAIDGNPAYTTTPIMGGVPVIAIGNTDTAVLENFAVNVIVQSINSQAVSFQYNIASNTATDAVTATAHFGAHGAV
jgi:hypothetical protein